MERKGYKYVGRITSVEGNKAAGQTKIGFSPENENLSGFHININYFFGRGDSQLTIENYLESRLYKAKGMRNANFTGFKAEVHLATQITPEKASYSGEGLIKVLEE